MRARGRIAACVGARGWAPRRNLVGAPESRPPWDVDTLLQLLSVLALAALCGWLVWELWR